VAKHKCGSCHFFQEAGLAGSGWCHHPQRKVSSDVLIMVRRNELACRDEWSRSLWQPREGQQANGDLPFQRPTLGPLPPTLAENLRSVLHHDTTLAASSQGEDVLLSEARIVSDPHEAWEPPPRPFPVGNFDPRTAIFRARETFRERVRAKAAADRQSAGVEAATDSSAEDHVAAGSKGAVDADPGDQTALEVRAAREEVLASAPEAGARLTDPGEPDWQAIESPVSAATARNGNPTITGRLAVASEPPLAAPPTEWQPIAERDETLDIPDGSTRISEEAEFAERFVASNEVEALPEWYRADLPRICRTCRDYRPSADGQRGWCANSWAFTHRRLVLEIDPAPCQSAIGDWWLPVDDIWLVAADVSSHGRPTPLLDRLTAKSEQKRRRS
jgi:hypothetical protein